MVARETLAILLVLAVVAGCSRAPDRTGATTAGDREAAEKTVLAFFDAISGYDYDSLRSVVTSDFELVEDTLVLDMPGFIDLVEPFEERGETITYELADFNTEVRGSVAWTRYRNRGLVSRGDEETRLEWLESAVLLRADGRWRIDRLQSTPVRVK